MSDPWDESGGPYDPKAYIDENNIDEMMNRIRGKWREKMSEYKTYIMQCFYHGKVYVKIEAKDIEQAKKRFENGFDDGIELKNPEDIEPDWSTLHEQ